MENSSKKSGFGKKAASVLLAVWITMVIGSIAGPVALAMTAGYNPPSTVLPSPPMDATTSDCEEVFSTYSKQQMKEALDASSASIDDKEGQDLIMGCAIKTGRISLWMVPYFIRYFIEFILYVGGLIAVGGILFGGATYVFSGLSNDKEKGKKAILYSVIGMVLMYMAWAIVNIVIGLLTG